MPSRKLPKEAWSARCPACGNIYPKLTVEELAAILNVTPGTIRRGGAGTSELPREYYGRQIRFDRRAVEEWLDRKAEHGRQLILFLRNRKLTRPIYHELPAGHVSNETGFYPLGMKEVLEREKGASKRRRQEERAWVRSLKRPRPKK
jgi:excisionase family DNA binding protein